MGLFKRRRSPIRGLDGASAQDALFAVVFGAEEQQRMPFADTLATMMRALHSAHARGQALYSTEAIAGREMRDWEAEPAVVLGEAMRVALQRKDLEGFEEVSNVGAVMMIRWQRWLMHEGLMPENDRWGDEARG